MLHRFYYWKKTFLAHLVAILISERHFVAMCVCTRACAPLTVAPCPRSLCQSMIALELKFSRSIDSYPQLLELTDTLWPDSHVIITNAALHRTLSLATTSHSISAGLYHSTVT